jgi:sporulation protein YlmC with PRC-barrel domain
MRLSDLRHKQVRTPDGRPVGRVFEVHCEAGAVKELMCGPGSFVERLTARTRGRRIPWEMVKRIEARSIIVSSAPHEE